MIVQHKPQLHLTYCQNIHPGETWTENFDAIKQHAVQVKQRVCPDQWFGLGLRLSAQAAADLSVPEQRAEALDFFASNHLYPFTINGFPYGRFHKDRVKEHVYAPDWRTPERRDYTIQLADILAGMLPEGIEGSISTVPCSFKPWITTDSEKIVMAQNLAACVAYLDALRDDTGRTINLGLEPEPDCFLETTEETVAYFKDYLLVAGVEEVVRILGCDKAKGEELVRRHLGVCFDTCHVAMQFENLHESLLAYRRAGIAISKIQISAALRTMSNETARDALAAFTEPVYLHQVKGLSRAGARFAWYDLPEAIQESPDFPDIEELRIHFHVPLFFPGTSVINTTANALTPDFMHELRNGACPHLEIETYTFDVLPSSVHPGDIVRSIAREYSWVLGRIEGL
ncbi:MAG TPA: metabolite traffic protein EboE [Chthoniobacteraceae bacterium]